MKKTQKKRKGFTLAELVVVVTIIGILMFIAISRFSSISDTANRRAFEANHKIACSAITMYMADNAGKMPANDADINAYISLTDSAASASTSGLKINGMPVGATYTWNAADKKLVSTYDGKTLTYEP